MSQLEQTRVFNNAARVAEGWFWALRSDELKPGKARPLNFLGRDLVIYRGEDGAVVALDAYCPHMGAHLADGKVEGNSIRCLFHYWKFGAQGDCEEIPCQKGTEMVPRQRAWPASEKYGLIWVWSGEGRPRHPVPYVPELGPGEAASRLGNSFVKECHPSVMMINAIDAQHFNSVHNLPVNLDLRPTEVNENCIVFSNATRVPASSWLTRFIGRFYRGALTYILSYWYGSTGSVTVGPDFLHFHIIFALRPTADGRSEGQTILVTKKRQGLPGALATPVLLALTKVVGDYFAKGDTIIFKSIKFNFKTPIKADSSIIRFIQHLERQKAVRWGLSAPETRRPEEATAWPATSPPC